MENTGIYFLANDDILEWVIAFLNSLRKYNPEIPLCLIPFDQKINRITRMRSRYNFRIYDNDKYLKHLEKIGRKFYLQTSILQFQKIDTWGATYRKLAIWDGPFKHFIFMDPDIVVFERLDFLFKYLDKYDFLLGRKNNFPSVWNEKKDINDIVHMEKQITDTFNLGFLVSRRNALTRSFMESQIPEALKIKEYFAAVPEQPLTHFFIHRSNKPYISIYDIFPDYAHEIIREYKDLRIKNKKAILPDGRKLIIAHWAGSSVPRTSNIITDIIKGQFIYSKLWLIYKYPTFLSKVCFYFLGVFYLTNVSNFIKLLKKVSRKFKDLFSAKNKKS